MNLFVLSGNLCADPIFSAGQEESKNRCNFRIAYNHNQTKTTFFSCTAWGKTAERVSKLTKGKRVLVQGEIEENEWDNQGQKQRDKQVNVRNAEYIDFPEQGAQSQPPAQQGYPQQPQYGNNPGGAYPGAPFPPQQQGYPQQPYGAPPAPQGGIQYGAPMPNYGPQGGQPPQGHPPAAPQYQGQPQYQQQQHGAGAPPQHGQPQYQQQGLPMNGQQSPF